MSQRSRKARERKEYEELQKRKKKRIEENKRRKGAVEDNPAKSAAGIRNKKRSKKGGRKKGSKKITRLLLTIQTIASIVFLAALLILNMLPLKYMLLTAGILILFLGITMGSQRLSKRGKIIAGRVFSILMSFVLFVGSYYTLRAFGAIGQIAGGGYKLDKIVVAVLADDPAATIQDAADYNFGVQYAMKGDEIRETVGAINGDLGREISTTEYDGLSGQAEALHSGAVDAIIYNEGYTSILQESFASYSDSVRIIYSYSIKSDVDSKAARVNVNKDCFAVYISGIDVYGAIETNSRSDVNIIAVVNPKTHQILLVTTPRDYYIEFPGITEGQRDKLTHAGIYGVDASISALESLYDTNIAFYTRLNFTSMIDIVDALGGIDVESEYAFTTSPDSEHIMDVAAGINHFNGEEALAFSRERQNIPDGDNQRGKNQQAVITAMIKKAISPMILLGANEIIDSASENMETNMSRKQIQDLVKKQLGTGSSWNIKSMAATGTGDNQYCYSYSGSPLYVTIPDGESIADIKAAIAAVENGEILDESQLIE